jgi:hypothetical protein
MGADQENLSIQRKGPSALSFQKIITPSDAKVLFII